MLTILYTILMEILWVFKIIVIVAAVFSLLTAFGVLDTRNRIVWQVGDILYRLTEPALRPIRNMLPSFGGVDFSPWVLIILIWVAQMMLTRLYIAVETGSVQGLLL